MFACTKAVIPRAFAMALGVILAASRSSVAVTGLPPVLKATPSGKDLILSFPSNIPNFYTLQTSSDLLQWSNLPGIPAYGYGTLQTVTMSNALLGSAAFYRVLVQQSASLVLPQGDAFAIVGYDCGGINEQVYVTGFDPTSGFPIGQVYLSTSCSAGKAGTPPSIHTGAASVMWDFGGNVISYTSLSNTVAVSSNFVATDAFGDTVYNLSYGHAYAYLVVPPPGAPDITFAAQSNDQFNVSWTVNGVNPVAVTSSILTATPINSTASVLTTTVVGSATSGVISALQPDTTYQITLVNNTVTGSSPPSAPITLSTSPATTVPGAPTNVTAFWSNPDGGDLTIDTINVAWQPGISGNSPIDEYQITITGSDGAGALTQTVSSPALTTYFNVSPTPNWSITVQAHNAAGWGPWSSPVSLGGL